MKVTVQVVHHLSWMVAYPFKRKTETYRIPGCFREVQWA